jgi:dTDP-4-amino-4,6-dideoxygalactose transaminase
MKKHMKTHITRRHFLETTSLAGAGFSLALPQLGGTVFAAETARAKPAKLGGQPLCAGFPHWPVFDQTEETALLDALRTGHWFRGNGKMVAKFEEAYAQLTGAKHCLATASGTAALVTVLGALDIGPGDEVVIPPFTFVATYNAIVLTYALPIFVDTDPESFQIDADKIEAATSGQTKAIMPVHMGGLPADLDKILEVGNRHKIPVIEDACQAHLAEWRGRKVGTWGMAGCSSFQASKNLTSGEGGAVLTNDDQFAEACYSFHYQGLPRKSSVSNSSYPGARGSNLRLSEFQASLLMAQMTRVVEQNKRRAENATYLNELLNDVPGIIPSKPHNGVTRGAYHLYMFRYDKAQFAGLERGKFLAALDAEGIPCSPGYNEMNKGAYVSGLAKNQHFLKIYGEQRLNTWLEQNANCPRNEQLCREAVWFTQNMLLGPRSDMDKIAEAIRRIQQHAAELARA